MNLTNGEVTRSNYGKNLFGRRLKVIISGSLIVFLFTTTCIIADFSGQSQVLKQKQQVAAKVSRIMALYNCDNLQIHAAIMNTFDPIFVAIIIGIESGYKTNAISPAGCRGLMQLSPDKLDDWTDISKNIHIGAAFLEEQLQRFGTVELAIAAYNAGPGSVNKYQGVPPYRETLGYLEKTRQLSAVHYPDLFSKTSSDLVITRYPLQHRLTFKRVLDWKNSLLQ